MKGQSLIEVLVGLGIISVVVTALAAVVITSTGNAQFSKNQNLATHYSTEGMEIMRKIRDGDYAVFRNIASGTYCLDKGSSNLSPNCNFGNVDNFRRQVTITHSGCAANVTRVIVTVGWQDSKCASANFCHKSELSSCLSAVNPVPAL